MAKPVGIGIQDFEDVIQRKCLYIDKTALIKEWWESQDSVTLITRPRRFGKTLNMSMLNRFFSNEYEGRGEVFEGLTIWKEEKYRRLQGSYPVINLSFATVKEKSYTATKERIYQLLLNLYSKYAFLRDSDLLTANDKAYWDRITMEMKEVDATFSLHQLSNFLCRYYGRKVIILLDEYDTPMQEAYVYGFWEELLGFTRSLFNATFKTNPWLERGMMTGVTRVSKESVFSDLNNLVVVTTTTDKYATAFGFTEEEVFAALDEYKLGEQKEKVKYWYNGFIFGNHRDIYNPWSILNFLDTKEYTAYWANTSSNSLVSKLLREGNREVKKSFEILLKGERLRCPIEEQIIYNQLDTDGTAIWGLLLASGYLRVVDYEGQGKPEAGQKPSYQVELTNFEVRQMFEGMIGSWFDRVSWEYSDFIRAMLLQDVDAMNEYMNRISLQIFSSFDAGKRPSGSEPERFYHGFVLGLMVNLQADYIITSNGESGFGRYDIMLEPKNSQMNPAIIIEFKVFNSRREKTLEETVAAALRQIEEKQYQAILLAKGIPADRICKYGFAFAGKTVLIEQAAMPA